MQLLPRQLLQLHPRQVLQLLPRQVLHPFQRWLMQPLSCASPFAARLARPLVQMLVSLIELIAPAPGVRVEVNHRPSVEYDVAKIQLLQLELLPFQVLHG